MFSCTTSFYELLQTFYWSQSHKLDYYDITNGVIGYHQVAPRRDPACIIRSFTVDMEIGPTTLRCQVHNVTQTISSHIHTAFTVFCIDVQIRRKDHQTLLYQSRTKTFSLRRDETTVYLRVEPRQNRQNEVAEGRVLCDEVADGISMCVLTTKPAQFTVKLWLFCRFIYNTIPSLSRKLPSPYNSPNRYPRHRSVSQAYRCFSAKGLVSLGAMQLYPWDKGWLAGVV